MKALNLAEGGVPPADFASLVRRLGAMQLGAADSSAETAATPLGGASSAISADAGVCSTAESVLADVIQ